nr:AMP-binding protein [Fodinicola feengrottensis]
MTSGLAAARRGHTVPDLLAARAAHQPDRLALAVGAHSLTFGEWEAKSSVVAGALRHRGVERGERVALVYGTRHWIDFAVAFCAVQKAGGVPVPVSERLAPAERDYILHHCTAAGVLHAEDVHVTAENAWSATLAKCQDGSEPVKGTASPSDLAQIIYTSGTTGRPKGVSATHGNLTFGCTTGERRVKLAHSDHFLHAFPVGTNACQTALLTALDARPAGVAMSRFTPGHLGRLIEKYHPGTLFLVPTMAIEALTARPPCRAVRPVLGSHGRRECGGAAPGGRGGPHRSLRKRDRGQHLHLNRGGSGADHHGVRPAPADGVGPAGISGRPSDRFVRRKARTGRRSGRGLVAVTGPATGVLRRSGRDRRGFPGQLGADGRPRPA